MHIAYEVRRYPVRSLPLLIIAVALISAASLTPSSQARAQTNSGKVPLTRDDVDDEARGRTRPES
jgi:hypothetical protein